MRLKRRLFVLASLLVLAYSPLMAAAPSSLHHPARASRFHSIHHIQRRHHRYHWMRWNPMFRPSHESLLLQNAEINSMDLPRIKNDEELEALKSKGDLVPIEPSESLRIQSSLEPSRRFSRPWTRDFVVDLSQAYFHRFHEQIQVNSAVRTVQVQKKLRRHNGNAAPAEGETASSHLAGITVDLQRRGMTKEQVRWVEQYLFYMKAVGLVEPEEERRHWCFHVMVSGRYAEWRETQDIVPMERPDAQTTASNGTD